MDWTVIGITVICGFGFLMLCHLLIDLMVDMAFAFKRAKLSKKFVMLVPLVIVGIIVFVLDAIFGIIIIACLVSFLGGIKSWARKA